MRRSDRVFVALACCAACSVAAPLGHRNVAVSPDARSTEPHASALPSLPVLARSSGPREPARILRPENGAEIEPARASELVVGVHAPGADDPKPSLELSLDGARPRPVNGTSAPIANLLDPGMVLAPGAHDLVLVAVGSDGMALDPRTGGVATARFFVGSRPAALLPPRLVCLAPFGTLYGAAPRIALDFVVVSGNPEAKSGLVPIESADVVVAIEGPGISRRARASGPGPFLLGEFSSGDHRVTLTPIPGSRPLLPGSCSFLRNPELERPP